MNCRKYLCIVLLPYLNGYLLLRNVSVDSSFDSLLTVSEDADYPHQVSKPFDHIAVLAYNGVRRAVILTMILGRKAMTLFDDMISEDGGMRDGPP